MDRRAVIGLLAAPAGLAAARARSEVDALHRADDADGWRAWKTAFLSDDGRVIDHEQSGASHSEGQGYGLVLAASFGDVDAFARIHGWTETFLAVRSDPLLAWRWFPDRVPQIADYNNATDGDLFYAWALLQGAVRFGEPDYARRARAIARFLAESCVVADPRAEGGVLLLPAMERFAVGGQVTINPSYYMPLALRELAAATDQPRLWRCADDGVTLLSDLMSQGAVPDWIEVDPSGWRPSAKHPPVSGYDALRVPLWLLWSGYSVPSKGDCRMSAGQVPTVYDLTSGRIVETSTYGGYRAIANLAQCADAGGVPSYETGQPYFPATLHLLALVAARGHI